MIITKLRAFLKKRAEIIFAYIHGSFAEGVACRDIDVAIYVNKDIVPKDEAIDYGLKISAIAEMETGIRSLDIKVVNYTAFAETHFFRNFSVFAARGSTWIKR